MLFRKIIHVKHCTNIYSIAVTSDNCKTWQKRNYLRAEKYFINILFTADFEGSYITTNHVAENYHSVIRYAHLNSQDDNRNACEITQRKSGLPKVRHLIDMLISTCNICEDTYGTDRMEGY